MNTAYTTIPHNLQTLESTIAGDVFADGGSAYGSEVLHAWREWTEAVPDEVTSIARIMRFPPLPAVPEPMRGRGFALVEAAYLGDAPAGAELLLPLRELGPDLDTFATILAPGLQKLHMDPPEPVDGEADGMLLSDFDAGFAMFAAGAIPTPALRGEVRAHTRALKEALAPWRAPYDYYYNFAETPGEADAVLPPAAYRRLRAIKAQYDRDRAVVSAHTVRPAA